jgi:hypothetical protein
MHITNLFGDEERPETIRKPNIPELDLDDLEALEVSSSSRSPDFSQQIALAAADGARADQKEQSNAKLRAARSLAAEQFKAVADNVREQTGISIGYTDPWAYNAQPKSAYNLWKQVITIYLDRPETLAVGPTAMAAQLNKADSGYVVTRDMFYNKLNKYAKKELARLLKTFGVTLPLRGAVTISSVRKALMQRRKAAEGLPSDEFTGRFIIRGDTFSVNGREYTIQAGKSGKPRIKHRGAWLPLEVLKSVCSEHQS